MFLDCGYVKLLDELAGIVTTLESVLEEIGFVKSQELSVAELAWTNTPDDSTQKKDRAAKYAAASITCELYRLEAQRDSLIETKFFLIRLLDDHRHGLR